MRFPLNPPRGLGVSVPLLRDARGVGDGHDVTDVQQAVNDWAGKHGLPLIAVDGVYGAESDFGVKSVAFDMGLLYTRPMVATLRLILHPWMRSVFDLQRERQRRAVPRQPSVLALAWEQGLAGQHFSAPGDVNPLLEQWAADSGLGNIAGEPWCQFFQDIALRRALGRPLPSGFLQGEPGYTPWVLDQARHGNFGLRTCDPQPGCWIYFSWSGNGVPDHVGMVVDPASRTTVEGNTGSAYGEHTVAVHSGGEHWPFACGFVWPWGMH